jgi:ribonuclease G
MSTELIINASLPETRIALMENGEIQDLLIERAQGKGIVGNIYKGRVTRVLPGMQAAFVDIGLEKAAFLYVDDVFVHSEVFEEEEERPRSDGKKVLAEVTGGDRTRSGGNQEDASPATGQHEGGIDAGDLTEAKAAEYVADDAGEDISESLARDEDEHEDEGEDVDYEDRDEGQEQAESGDFVPDYDDEVSDEEDEDESPEEDDEEDEDEDDPRHHHDDDDQGPTEMSAEGGDDDQPASDHPGTISEPQGGSSSEESSGAQEGNAESGAAAEGERAAGAGGEGREDRPGRRGRHRRGRRGGKFRRRNAPGEQQAGAAEGQEKDSADYPSNFVEQVSDEGNVGESDRSMMHGEAAAEIGSEGDHVQGRPGATGEATEGRRSQPADRQGFRSQRDRERRVPSRSARKPSRTPVSIQDLLKEGQEVLVQVAKDPIATKGARLTCHISLPGRHLVCMPTIDHVGVSRRIDRDDERRKLRDIVERNRPRNLGFIVRTASGRGQAEKRIKQDIDYLTRLWDEIREKSANVTAPALVYEDLNSILRAIRDWVTDDIDKIIVDSRYHYNEIQRFVSHFMPSLKQKVELYHGDIPIFDAYNISTELSRALERKVWLKSGGYIVIDQAEALVAIDVNTGRYVGKKNLEDTILKTNLEAVQEIAYQLRLRNCGGIIILDLIDMEKDENKQRVYRALEEALKRDRARPTILKISELGLVEMTRKRTRDTIVRSLCESCTHCEGKGFIKSKTTVAYEVLREIEREGIERSVSKILVQAHPDVIDILAIDERETLDQIERRYRKQIYLQAVTDSHPEQFEVVGDKKPGKQSGEFSEVVQPLRTHTSSERSNDRDRERGGRRDRGRGRDRDRNRDRDRDQERNQDRNADRNREERGGQQAQPPRQIRIPQQQQQTSIEGTGAEGAGMDAETQAGSTGSGPIIQRSSGDQGADDNFGNRANYEPSGNVNGSAAQGNTGGAGAGDTDDFYDEEDRLAFLRAQAAQDAALARFRTSGEHGHPQNNSNRGGGGGGGRDRDGGRRQRRGRRGGKFRRDDNRDNRNRGPRQFGNKNNGQQGQSGNSDSQRTQDGGSSGNSGGSGNGEGGGGDHSQPPV